MIEEKDVKSLVGWGLAGAFLETVIPVTVISLTISVFDFMKSDVVLENSGRLLGASAASGVAEWSLYHAIALKEKYEPEDLQRIKRLTVPLVAGICAGVYAAISEIAVQCLVEDDKTSSIYRNVLDVSLATTLGAIIGTFKGIKKYIKDHKI